MPRSRRDGGYALLAAVAGLAAFGYIALSMLAAERGQLAGASAARVQAELGAAADAALVTAAARVGTNDRTSRWRIDGRAYPLSFGRVRMTIRIEDERGKIPLQLLDEAQARLMLEGAGVQGRRLDELTDALLDWIDPDDDRRPYGAEAEAYAGRGVVPRNGPIGDLGELALIRGMDRRTFDRIAPAVTTFRGSSGPFSPTTAQPLAVAVMLRVGMGAPQVIERQRELAGQVTAIDIADAADITARPLGIRVVAEDSDGGRLERFTIIEFPAGARGRWDIRYRR